jgi:CheY-like chemotaxis protein
MAILDKKRVLCIDDSHDSCELMGFVLSEAGYEIESGHSLMEGLSIAQGGEFSLYLIDLTLPDGSGFDLIEKIREFDAATPIVVCSGDARDSSRNEAEQAEIQAFLVKPIDPDLLTKTVTEVLSNEVQG